jgi:hypothetical protein
VLGRHAAIAEGHAAPPPPTSHAYSHFHLAAGSSPDLRSGDGSSAGWAALGLGHGGRRASHAGSGLASGPSGFLLDGGASLTGDEVR